MKRLLTEALRDQFNSTLHMASVLVDVCPEEVWAASYNGVPFWQQVFHYVYFADLWLRKKYDGSERRVMIFDDAFTTDLYADSYEGRFLSRESMGAYLAAIQKKTTAVFDGLNDEKLEEPVLEDDGICYTSLDIICGQIRHIMYNIGYLNGILRAQGLPESDWYSHNEPQGA